MIKFHYQTDFQIKNERGVADWIAGVIRSHKRVAGEISYIFCDDRYLYDLNRAYLDHDWFTDVISFDYSLGKELHGEVYVSVDRVQENAIAFNAPFEEELHRVMVHGVLHYCGFKDKTEAERTQMREAEDKALALREGDLDT